MRYNEFIESKAHIGQMSGFEPLWMPDVMFDFQKNLTDWAIRKGRAAIFADCGLGKGLRPYCPVLTPAGFVPLSGLKVGDDVIGADGQPTKIIGYYPRGQQPLYRVTFSDSVQVVCDADHIWSVKNYNDVARGKSWRNLTTRQLSETNLKYGQHGMSRTWQIPLVKPVYHPDASLPLHPYLVGVLLGDGCLTNSVSWCKPDVEIADRIRGIIPSDTKLSLLESGNGSRWSITGSSPNKNPALDSLRQIGLYGKRSWEKTVPPQYMTAPTKDRIDLLQGMMDTDGYAGESPEFSSASEELAKSVVRLVESLGGTASLNVKDEPTYEYNGERRVGRPSYRVCMTLPPGINPFYLPRKAENYKTASRGLGRWIDSIERDGVGETICIKVAADDGLFVIDRYVVTHNTLIQLAWAENVVRQTNKPVLILTPLAVAAQTVHEAEKFGMHAEKSAGGSFSTAKIIVTNYEKLHHFNTDDFSGVVCDESSCLKNFDGIRKAAITEFMRTRPYRLLCTATAAPNDWVELGTSAEALGEMGFQDMVTLFFKKETSKDHLGWGRTTYRMRPHAEKDFWRWVCSWARAIRRPSDLGFEDGRFILPPLIQQEHVVKANTLRTDMLFDIPAATLQEQRDERRRTLPQRCELAASIATSTPDPVICWCHLNPEGDLIEKMIPGAIQVSGDNSDEEKEELLQAFATGQARVLVSKPQLAGFGLNFQHCAHQTFFPSHSFEQWYQAVRRSYRFGQVKPVKVDIVTSEGEVGVLKNLQRKARQAEDMFQNLVALMNDQLNINRTDRFTKQTKLPQWLVA